MCSRSVERMSYKEKVTKSSKKKSYLEKEREKEKENRREKYASLFVVRKIYFTNISTSPGSICLISLNKLFVLKNKERNKKGELKRKNKEDGSKGKLLRNVSQGKCTYFKGARYCDCF